MLKKQRQPRHYDIHMIPARRTWVPQFQLGGHDPGDFARTLSCLVRERGGNCAYFPDRAGSRTNLRLEWHLRDPEHCDLLRVGLVACATPKALEIEESYLTTNTLVEKPWRALPDMSEETISRFQREVIEILKHTAERLEHPLPFHCVTHVETPPGCGFRQLWVAPDRSLRALPTVIVKDRARSLKRVTVLVLSVHASTQEQARDVALESAYTFAALATLSTGSTVRMARLSWQKKRPPKQTVADPSSIDVQRLYPNHTACAEDHEFSAQIQDAVQQVLPAFKSLDDAATSIFKRALFAFYAARDIEAQQPTSAIVSYVACLNSLATDGGLVDTCPGQIVCAEHGPLGFKHRTRGDANAIARLIHKLLSYADTEWQELESLVRSVYSTQRSAYVHGATLRHAEFEQERHPDPLPFRGKCFSPIYDYSIELESFARITRAVLLRWLERTGGRNFDLGDLFPKVNPPLVARPFEGRMGLTVNAPSVMRFAPWKPGELESAAKKDDAGAAT